MKTPIEDRLRTHFTEVASRFSMDPSLPPPVTRRARRRVARTAAVAAVLVAVGVGSAVLASGPDRGTHRARTAAHQTTGTTAIRLVDYADDSDGSGLRAYAQCMRNQGYDVPDPVRTDQGWSILVPPGSIDRTSLQWREAAFVTCNLEKLAPRPLSGDLVLGFDEPTIDRFIACMRGEGYDLPKPAPSADGEYRWDLRGLGVDTRSDAWMRALLVTCSPTGD